MSVTLMEEAASDGGVGLVDAEPLGLVCEKCEAELPEGGMTACLSCGWYASLSTYVEIAQEWEEAAAGHTSSTQEKTVLEVWATLIPVWGWVMIGTALAVVAASLGVRLWTIDNDSLRTTCSVIQLLVALSVLGACHLGAFFMVASTDPDMGVMDLAVNPLKAWVRLCANLPLRFWVLNTANACLAAALCSALVIGGLPYDQIWNWGVKQPAKKNLLGAVAEHMGAGGGDDMSMEEAMGEFAQNAAVGGGDLGGDKQDAKPGGEIKRQTIDAVILGYELTPQGQITQFYLAAEHSGKLLYAGRVRPLLTDEQRLELPAKLQEAHSARPLIAVPGSAIWLKPRFTCRVTFHKRVESGMLQGMVWEDLLGEVQLPSLRGKR